MKLLDSKTCEASLCRRYADNNCNRSPYLLHKESFIPINNGYIIIPLDKLTIDISCIDSIKSRDLIKPAEITGSNCKIYNNYDQLDLREKITDKYVEWLNVTYEMHYDQTDLEKLKDRLIQLPKQINTDELRRARLSLDDTENILETIATHRCVKTWKETSLKWLQYFSYGALGLITLFTLYKLGLLDVIRSCIPKKLCLFCVKTNVKTPTHAVTYNAGVQPLLQQERIKTRGIKI